jgi:hypothetical protein
MLGWLAWRSERLDTSPGSRAEDHHELDGQDQHTQDAWLL